MSSTPSSSKAASRASAPQPTPCRWAQRVTHRSGRVVLHLLDMHGPSCSSCTLVPVVSRLIDVLTNLLAYAMQDVRLTPEEAGDCDRRACRQATAGFEPSTNTVFFYRPSWHKQPSLSCPVQADGVYCTNRLQWLAHTLGHEMVHAIVHHACPEARSMQAYTASHGHGPIFLALNKHIFGHDTARYRAGWGRLRPHLKVQPLQVTHSFQQGVSSEEGCESEQGQVAQLAVVGDATCLQRSGSGSEDWECTVQLQQQQQLGLHSEQQQPLLRSKAVPGASAAQRPHAQWLWKQFADK